MASDLDTITYKVNLELYRNNTTHNFRAFSNHLVDDGILSEQEFDQYRPEIGTLFDQWRKGSQTQQNQQQPLSPESLPPQGTPPKNTASSPPQDVRPDCGVETLEEAVKLIDKSGPLLDPHTASLYQPGKTNHDSVPVAMSKSSCSQSYIRAETLELNKIDWTGKTVTLRWKSAAMRGDEDQRVQQTCFQVVHKTEATQAGFHFDMLVGNDHGLPLQQQVRALGAEETSSADSSVVDGTDDNPTQSSDELDSDTERRQLSLPSRGPPPPSRIAMFFFEGPDARRNCVDVYRDLQPGRHADSTAVESSGGRSIESRRSGSGKRKLSHGDNSEGPSRRNRPFGE
ncbi:hypothetical protein J7T55_011164 [Diaporthe amygdali]|uniref:uncharacterized protein n=1 Tax=Phomopsis amygdali TaxID=1214568 RepID=UPI0022FF0FEC|nr:uncharacterized protein J7T55_011164 [Diaporthe amygdali]KAJ0104379.1 hypothetical protein J7T55_011164 [Diaporthe amygdali]